MVKVAAIYKLSLFGNKLHLQILWRTIRVWNYSNVGVGGNIKLPWAGCSKSVSLA